MHTVRTPCADWAHAVPTPLRVGWVSGRPAPTEMGGWVNTLMPNSALNKTKVESVQLEKTLEFFLRVNFFVQVFSFVINF